MKRLYEKGFSKGYSIMPVVQPAELTDTQAHCEESVLEGWKTHAPVRVREVTEDKIGVLIKLDSGIGSVRFFENDRDLGARQTHPQAEKKVMMVILKSGCSCWLMDNALVNFILPKAASA